VETFETLLREIETDLLVVARAVHAFDEYLLFGDLPPAEA
jgi:hypothetical protein